MYKRGFGWSPVAPQQWIAAGDEEQEFVYF